MFVFLPVMVFVLIILTWVLWLVITYSINEYLIPLLNLSTDYTMTLQFWCLIALVCLILWFAIFSKKLESEKFKDYLNKN